jgi:hypothetical protein
MENGRRRHLKTKERLPPRKAGRPPLLNDDELRSAYAIYQEGGLSMNDLATSLATSRPTGTWRGYFHCIRNGWQRLGLPLRPKHAAQAMAHHRRGRVPREKNVPCDAVKRDGTPCTAPRKIGERLCITHLRYGSS